jgi:hypothetical protein
LAGDRTTPSPASTLPQATQPLPAACPAQPRQCGPVWPTARPAASTRLICRQSKSGSLARSLSITSGAESPCSSSRMPSRLSGGLAKPWLMIAPLPVAARARVPQASE